MNDRSAYTRSSDIPDDLAGHLGSLLLMLADNKRVLGIRYSDWILGAPSVEAGIACSAMAQDEWGHCRIVYAVLKDFGMVPHELEHEREADDYRNSELIDADVASWPELLAINFLFDTAVSVHFESLDSSAYEPIHYKVRKLLDEERFHLDHGRGWVARLGQTEAGSAAMQAAFEEVWDSCLRLFGPDDHTGALALAETGITTMTSVRLRERWLELVSPTLSAAGVRVPERSSDAVEWNGWSEARGRASAGGPDADTLARIRGDKNRTLLMD